jgi:hypothetical protein
LTHSRVVGFVQHLPFLNHLADKRISPAKTLGNVSRSPNQKIEGEIPWIDLTATEFLYRLISGQITVGLFPDDLLAMPQEFTPFSKA